MKEVVIAAYERDYSWIQQLNSDIKKTVYRKGNGQLLPNEILIEPNVGRDVHTFFYHLYSRYENLSDVTFFSQDFPFDHVSNYVDIINGDINLWNVEAVQFSSDGYWIFHSQKQIFNCDLQGNPHHAGLNLSRMWAKLFDDPCPCPVHFTPAGHFGITNKQVHKYKKEFYKKILDILATEPLAPYEIERFESYIFL